MSKTLKIGVIGAGNRGTVAQHAHKPEDGVELVAAADIIPKVLETFKEKTNKDVFVTDDYRKLLEIDEIDAVFICTPDNLHEEHAIASLNAGKDVYLEKPIAITVEGADRILQAACDNKRKLYLGHNMRHMTFVLKMKEIIDSGMIGEVKAAWCRHFVGFGGDFYFKDWHADRRNTTSLLLQKGAHDIDIIHWLCGSYSNQVSGMGELMIYGDIKDKDPNPEPGKRDWSVDNWPPRSLKGMNPVVDVEDLSMVMMRMNNGVMASYQQCHFTPDYWRNYTIIGTEGRIENFDDCGKDTKIKLWNNKTHYNGEADVVFNVGSGSGAHGGADPKIIAEFIRFLLTGCKINTSPIAARHSVAVGCLASESLRNGSVPKDIPPLSKEIEEYFA